MSSAQTQTRAQPPDHHVDEDVDADAAIDEEDITLRCCAPVYALTAPVEVGEIGFVDPFSSSSSSPQQPMSMSHFSAAAGLGACE